MRAALALCYALGLVAQAAPSPEQVKAAYRASDSLLLDRHGAMLESVRVDMTVRRLPWVALADVSPALPRAVMQAEDQRFMQHGGVDLRAIGTAAWDNLFRSRARGASTITMQLAAQLDPQLAAGKDGRTLGQKWDQAMAARDIESSWSKQQILEAYLNLVPFRGELRGVGAAAQGLFGKAPSGLDMTESVILASLVRNPAAAPKLVARRACALARELAMRAPCSSIEWEALKALSRPAALPAPDPLAHRLIGAPAARVRSTIDGDLQRFAQTTLRRQLAQLGERNVNDGALVVLDNASGEILAYVANRGDSEVDGVTALRQAGSTLKPFLYGLAIERRLLTAASLLDDAPVDIATPGGMYVPQNYDHEFKGHVSVRNSLASSLNVPAVRTLMMTGLERFHQRLREVGIDTLAKPADYYGYSLALGSAEVRLIDLANAYRVLANGGQASAPTLQPRAPVQPRRVFDAGAVFIVDDILSDRAARSLTFGLSNELATTYWSAVKTGTSKDMRDNWAIGFSDRYTVGVWVGNFNGSAMWDVSGVSGAAPVWRDVMDYLHQDAPGRAPVAPHDVVRRTVRFEPALEPARGEWFLRGTESSTVALVGEAARTAQILYPAPSAIIAIDPDIPADRERVFFQAQAGQGLRWQLDGEVLGSAATPLAWQPMPGAHLLALVDAAGDEVARSAFSVRGNARRAN